MDLRILRIDGDEHRTIGLLVIDGVYQCYTLEDAVQAGAKVPGRTAIPVGRYRVIVTLSERFGRALPLLLNVPGFDGIRIHPGNTDADTTGCVLLGVARTADRVVESVTACALVQRMVQRAIDAKQDVWVSVENVMGVRDAAPLTL